jgi:hypothetical protein
MLLSRGMQMLRFIELKIVSLNTAHVPGLAQTTFCVFSQARHEVFLMHQVTDVDTSPSKSLAEMFPAEAA